ncbi:hypothetical protein Ahy_B02g057700 [Arachis hypogaea]|uniref:RRM domain-containing protein n=2 Tax=Arachis hypogaea TaxID=3818 RepID=A0A445AD16_ARAHY|nr:hypothetical protein Ahy_B02g057700 [Arachis hypogaea]
MTPFSFSPPSGKKVAEERTIHKEINLQRKRRMVDCNNNTRKHNDSSSNKIFVGGLAWETQKETLRRYFEQFGDIIEAVVITDKNTGRSKGYGFVTFKDPEAAKKACQNPSPIIDGRRANCNIASTAANKKHSQTPQHERFKPVAGILASPSHHHFVPSSTFFHQPNEQFRIPYPTYRYNGYSQETMVPMNCYAIYGGQQFSPYYPSNNGAIGPLGFIPNIYPLNAQYAHRYHSHQGHGFRVQYPQMMQIPVLPPRRPYGSPGILTFPPSMPPPPITNSVTRTATKKTEVATRKGASASRPKRTSSI